MLSSAAPERAIPLERSTEAPFRLLAWIVSVTGCVLLLTAVRYFPTYFSGKVSLFVIFLGGFWGDLRAQFGGLLSGIPQGSLAGEVASGQWTYCVLVPFIVAWLVWRLWPQLRAAPVRGEAAGYLLLGGGLLLYLAGFWVEEYYFGVASLELIYAGLIVLFLGWPIMRLLIFPCVFLLFMWPYEVFAGMALELRLVMAQLSHDTLQVLGVPNIVQGTAVLSDPSSPFSFALDVADPCSGIRSLFALLMIAALYGFLVLGKFWQQMVIVALAIPLAIVGNLVRLVLLALATIHFGEPFAVGTNDTPSWFHEGVGYLVYIINLGGLLLVGWSLGRFFPGEARTSGVTPDRRPEETENPVLLKRSLWVLALFSLTLLICLSASPPKAGTSGVVMDLPDQVGPLEGRPQKISTAELTILPPDTTFARKTYGTPEGDPAERILCTIVQSGNVPRSLHRPERCLPAQGYVIKGGGIVTIPLKSGHLLPAQLYFLEQYVALKDGRRITVKSDFLYWYVGDGVASPSRWTIFLTTNWDLLFRHLNQRWSYVYVMGHVLEGLKPFGRTPEQTLNLLEAFIRESVPSFMRAEMPPDVAPGT
jgi:exosortase